MAVKYHPSNFGARHLAYAQAAAEKHHFLGLVYLQHKYDLMCRLPELELLPAALDLGMGVVTFSPLAMGLLSGSELKPVEGKQRPQSMSGIERYPDCTA
ncbi:aldo/keto reductase [Neobacillus cucumis]|uniref:aldo/keto reductase n=1 Tax=Neobacillus cucumis TaxID=1740721 RepID=UPI001965001A|nr:aldo/keto reductase [Neobacillus cucumis]